MFNKKEDVQFSKASTLLGEGCKFEGQLKAIGTLRIDGEFKGEIYVEGNLFIGEKGKILGNIQADHLMVSGEIRGNVSANSQLRICTGGRLYGDVQVKTFILDENSFFEGNCKMLRENVLEPQTAQ